LHILHRLGNDFKEICAVVRARDTPISFDELHENLVDYEMQQKISTKVTTPVIPTANYTQRGNRLTNRNTYQGVNASSSRPWNNSEPRFNRSQNNTRNHGASWQSKSSGPSSTFNKDAMCNFCSRNGQYIKDRRSLALFLRENEITPTAHFTTTQLHASPAWIFDTGASHNVTTDTSNLQSFSDYGGPEEIILGDGSGLHILHLGHTSFKYKSRSFKLNNILCVPALKKNLIFVAKFTKTVKDLSTGAPLLRGENNNDLYCMPSMDSPQLHLVSLTNVNRWHNRLGHPSSRILHFVLKSEKLSSISSSHVISNCHSCQCNKSQKLPFAESSLVSTQPLQLVYSDVWVNLKRPSCAPAMIHPESETEETLETSSPSTTLPSTQVTPPEPSFHSRETEPSLPPEPEQRSQTFEHEPSTSTCPNNIMHTSDSIQTSTSSDQPSSLSQTPLPYRPVRQRKPNTKYYGPKFVNHTTTAHPLPVELEPCCVTQALKHREWREAMSEEFNALIQNHTWDLVPRTSQNLLGNKWVFRVKRFPDGSIQKFKTRLVAKGFHQRQGIDYTETFSPVTKPVTIRVILCLALSKTWPLRQLDINNAFLNGTLQEEVYMAQPVGFIHPQYPNHVCKLRKALYDLKQAPRAWYIELKSFLVSYGFTNSVADTSLFIYNAHGVIVYFLVYIDDIIITGNNTSFIDKFVQQLHDRFALKDLGELHQFLGVEVISTMSGIFPSQHKYIRDILKTHHMDEAKEVTTPMHDSIKLTVTNETSKKVDSTTFRKIVGKLQYLAMTRLDISYATNKLSQYMHDPSDTHWQALKRLLRYLKRTIHFGLFFKRNQPLSLSAFSDSDWGGAQAKWEIHYWLCCLSRSRMKHIALDYHFVCEQILSGRLKVKHISTKDQLADYLTKALSRHPFLKFRPKIGVTNGTAILRGRISTTRATKLHISRG
ncbi:retrovirus-related pol polyprotein from transposon TNT 1-94, partial [Tanacetum coccineum]